MSKFLNKYNYENVHTRGAIVGLINLLNSKIRYEQVLSNTEINVVTVPFYYNMGGDERFLQDYFVEWSDCIYPKHAEGNYDVIPRGIITLSSKGIDSSKMTNRFVRGTYVKEVKGQLQQFNSFLNSVPVNLTFDIEVETDTYLDMFKIEQSILETFYKVQIYSFYYKGFKVPCQVSFPDSYDTDHPTEFTYQSDIKNILKFSLEVETYFPITDGTTERSNTNRIFLGNNTVSPTISFFDEDFTPSIRFTSPVSDELYFSGGTLPFSWVNTGTIFRVNLFYRIRGTQEWVPIVQNLNNHGYYDWKIPFLAPQTNVAHVNSKTGRNAVLRALVNEYGSVEKIIVFSGGIGYEHTDSIDVALLPEFISNTLLLEPPVIMANIISGQIVSAKIHSTGSGFLPTEEFFVELKIEDANNPSVYHILDNTLEFVGDLNFTAEITNVFPLLPELFGNVENYEGALVEGFGIEPQTIITGILNPSKILLSKPTYSSGNSEKFTCKIPHGTIRIR